MPPTTATRSTLVRRAAERDLPPHAGAACAIRGSAATGYGEDLIRHAFHVDYGRGGDHRPLHAPRATFSPDVDFILDIGGQDIKCFKIRNGAIDSIMLNEACSSGCGSFIETFANAHGL